MFLDFSRKLVGRYILGSYLLRSILMILQIFTLISLKENQRTSATGQPILHPGTSHPCRTFTELKGLKNSHLRMDPEDTVQRWDTNLVAIFESHFGVALI